jgi:hypothetical protein
VPKTDSDIVEKERLFMANEPLTSSVVLGDVVPIPTCAKEQAYSKTANEAVLIRFIGWKIYTTKENFSKTKFIAIAKE